MALKQNAKKPETIFLDNARTNGELKNVTGRYIKVVGASSATATILVATDRNFPEEYETLTINGEIYQDDPFDRIFIKNTAQAGEWVRLIISEGPKSYDVSNPSTLTVNGITDAVKIKADPATNDGEVAVADASARTDLATIAADIATLTTLFQTYGKNGARQGVTDLTGATYAQQTAAATNNVVTAGANTNGIIIHFAGVFGAPKNAEGTVLVNSNSLIQTGSSSGGTAIGAVAVTARDILIPAGVALDLNCGAATDNKAWVWYTKL